MRIEAVTFSSNGKRLVGVLRTPDNGTYTGLITVHGWGANRIGPNNMLADLCAYSVRKGFASLDFDLSGRGDSEGDPASICVDDMMGDTIAAVELMHGKGITNIVLFGLCSGGNAALGAVALGAKVTGVIAVSTLPFVAIEDVGSNLKKTSSHARGYLAKLFRAQTWAKLFRGGISFKGVYRTLFGHMSKKHVASDRVLKDTRHDIMKKLMSFDGNILHVYGGTDPESAPAQAYFETGYSKGRARTKFVTIPNANHNFYSVEWRRSLTELTLEMLSSSR